MCDSPDALIQSRKLRLDAASCRIAWQRSRDEIRLYYGPERRKHLKEYDGLDRRQQPVSSPER